ncbi:MAG: hypothetical protein HY863_09365 [Chloroflexi bacterium]|nr:hypothetical protein [Chloroflexota bacterium]
MLAGLPKHRIKIFKSDFCIRDAAQEKYFSFKRIPSNLKFTYLYRDASNYKLHGEAVFTNQTFMPIDEIEKQIRSCLKDGEFFIARQVNIEERFFDVLHEEDDHPWHEFNLVEMTTEPPFDPENWRQHKHKRDITEFIGDLEKTNRAGWDEMKVRADVVKLMEKRKKKQV